jgi:hypothetical protein
MGDNGNTSAPFGDATGGEDLRRRAHQIIEHLPLCELKAAIIALEELEVSVRVRNEWPGRPAAEV